MKKLTFLTAIFIASSTLAQVPNYVPTNGLVGWWPFNGNANDESGNGNNGTVNGATLTSDRFGYTNCAYNFNANTDLITCNSISFQNQEFTISGWCKLITGFSYTTFNLVKFGPNNPNSTGGYSIRLDQNDGIYGVGNYQIYGYISDNSNYIFLNQVSPYSNFTSAQNWNHYVLTKSADSLKIYLNNSILNSVSTQSMNISFLNAILQFGNQQNLNNNLAGNRQLDDIGIWNRALTQQEITNLYNGVYNLPVELTQFSATCSENTTTINWQTASENNSAYFEVLKSRDGEVWTSKTTTPAAGNSTSTIDYSFTDNNEASLVYYKLKQVDKDGKSKEYGPISANCNENNSLSISPNPTNGEFNLVGMEHFGTISSLEIKDAAGKVVKVLNPTATNFSCVGLKAGVYFLAVTSNKTERIIKIIKE